METTKKVFLGIFIALLIGVVLAVSLPSVIRAISPPTYMTYEELLENLENSLIGKGNGGLDKDEIISQTSNLDCPTDDDFFSSLYIDDYGEYVVFYRTIRQDDGTTLYPNALFAKTSEGLVYDGVLNVEYKLMGTWWGGYDYQNKNNGFVAYFDEKPTFVMPGHNLSADNIVTGVVAGGMYSRGVGHALSISKSFISDMSQAFHFCFWDNLRQVISGSPVMELQDISLKYLGEHFSKYFMDFEGVEIICDQTDKSKMMDDLNGFYTYLYNQGKSTFEYEGDPLDPSNIFNETQAYQEWISSYHKKVVNATNLMLKLIPEDERINYPADSSLGFKDNVYSTYKCNKYIEIYYNYRNVEFKIPDKDIIEQTSDPTVPPEDPNTYVTVMFQLVNSDNSNLANYSYENNPVKLVINGQSYLFNSYDKFYKGIEIGLKTETQYTYSIDSSTLIFDSYSGSFTTSEDDGIIKFNYSYMNGYAVTSVSITPLSSYDDSTIDLSNHPVKVIFTGKNGEGTFQYVFDDNSKLATSLTQLLKIGEYDYSILSEQLIFGSVSGTIEVTPQNRSFVFTYALKLESGDLDFDVTVTNATKNGSVDFKLSGSQSTVTLLSNKLEDEHYLVKILVFNSVGDVVVTFDHTHQSGPCSDSFNSNNTLVNGETYTFQMRYMNAEGSISYVSDTFNITYDNSLVYTLAYSATEVA